MSWKYVSNELPEPGVKVKLSAGMIGAGGLPPECWESEGWLTQGGIWSVKWQKGMPKFPNPTHWKEIKNNTVNVNV